MKIFLVLVIMLAVLLLVLLVFCLFTKIRLVFTFRKSADEELITQATMEALGGFWKKNLSDINIKKKNKPKQNKSGNESPNTFRQKVSKYYDLFLQIKSVYSRSKPCVRKNVIAEKIRLYIVFGLDDAAKTGMATGVLWAGIYNVIAFAAGIIRVAEPDINVTPYYEDEHLELDGECIIRFTLANSIIIICSLAINYLKVINKSKNKEKAAINYVNTN